MTQFVLGAVVGALLMLAVCLRRFAAKRDELRANLGWRLVHLHTDLQRFAAQPPDPYAHHAPMRLAHHKGYVTAIHQAQGLIGAVHRVVLGEIENDA